MSAIAIVLGKERRMVARFAAMGAVSRERARTLDDVGVSRGLILRRLRERAVIREAAPGHYYLDEQSWAAVRRSRRRAIHIAAAILLALLLVFFGVRQVQAPF